MWKGQLHLIIDYYTHRIKSSTYAQWQSAQPIKHLNSDDSITLQKDYNFNTGNWLSLAKVPFALQ